MEDRAHKDSPEEEPKGLNDEEFIELINIETQQKMQQVAYNIVGNTQDAEDVLQESLTKALGARSSFRGESQPETWLHAIVKNTALTARKKKYGRAVVELPFMDHEMANELANNDLVEPDVSEQVFAHVLFERMKAKIDELSPALKSVLVLAAAGLTHRMIAKRLDISEATAKVRLHRARLNLKDKLDLEDED